MEPLEIVLAEKGAGLYVVDAEATVLDAVALMCDAHVGALLVTRDGKIDGVFSERDLMTRVVLGQLDPAHVAVGDVATRSLLCVKRTTSPHDAMSLMTKRRVRHLPVVEGTRVLGIVSIGDLVRWTLRDKDHEIEQLYDYVTGRYPG